MIVEYETTDYSVRVLTSDDDGSMYLYFTEYGWFGDLAMRKWVPLSIVLAFITEPPTDASKKYFDNIRWETMEILQRKRVETISVFEPASF